MSDKETGMSKVSSMREVQAILYEYREEDIQVPYLLAECVDYLIAERDRLREALIQQTKRTAYYNGANPAGKAANLGFTYRWEEYLCDEARAILKEDRQ